MRDRLTKALMEDDGATPMILVRKVRELEAAFEQAKQDMADAEAEIATLSRKSPASAVAWKALAEAVENQDYDARLKARQLVIDTFSRIVVYRQGVSPMDGDGTNLDLVLIPRGGAARALSVHRKTGKWTASEDISW